MSAEVDWVLDAIKSNWSLPTVGYGEDGYGGPTYGGAHFEDAPMKRTNRDESTILEGDIHTRKGELKESNFVGASLASRTTSPVGTEYDHDLETVVDVRIEGLHHSEWGHVDPAGDAGLIWEEVARTVRETILVDRTWPAVGRPDTTYHSLTIENETDRSSEYRDFYNYRFAVRFHGYEGLPSP